MFCIKIWGTAKRNFDKPYFGTGASCSRYFLGGVEADIFYHEPEKIWSRIRAKMALLRNTDENS